MVSLGFIVLRTQQIEEVRVFYTTIGLTFVEGQHGTGPKHYACDLEGIVIEIYPTSTVETDSTMLGFNVESLATILSNLQAAGQLNDLPSDATEKSAYTVRDPDGRRVRLTEVQD